MLDSIQNISGIHFGILSTEEIIQMSAVEVNNPKKNGVGSVYDPRMGTVDNTLCQTCGLDAISCPGHFGHIKLEEAIVHPLYIKKVVSILRCVCANCKRLVISQDHIALKQGTLIRSKMSDLKKIISRIEMCAHCTTPIPSYKHNSSDNTIVSTYEDPESKEKVSIELKASEIFSIFEGISNQDIISLGMNPEMTRPSSMIIQVLPVLPPCCRPFVKAAGNLCDDDLSNQYTEIIKINQKLQKMSLSEIDSDDSKRIKLIQGLNFRIATTFNNSAGRAKHTTNGRPIKCIKNRISGKDGQMRGNIMGRRANQTARTVIGPDTFLKNGEMSIPKEVAKTLTMPEIVNRMNMVELTKIVNSGNAKFVIRKRDDGKQIKINLEHALFDKGTPLKLNDIIQTENGNICKIGDNSMLSHDRYSNGLKKGDKLFREKKQLNVRVRKKRHIELNIGDTVERHLRDGDMVVLNRQPTLHKASMMSFKVFVRDGKTFRFNLASTKAFNADFDGDEMNIHVPQSQEARAEIEFLSTVKDNLITGQTSKMNIVIVQDGILGAYLMTKKDSPTLTKGQFQNALMRTSVMPRFFERLKEIEAVIKQKGLNRERSLFSGRGIVSMILPSDFNYKKKIGKEESEPYLEIFKGVIIRGCLSKTAIGSSHGCIPHYIHNEYGPQRCLDFLDDIQFVTNAYLEITSFTVGFKDCFSKTSSSVNSVKDTISRCFMEANAIENNTRNNLVRESRVNNALGKAKDIGLRIAKNNLDPNNSFISTVTGGSKGDFFNIAQITGLLGQQNISGKRLPLFLNNGTRSIPHYPSTGIRLENQEEASKMSPLEKYESRGFISSSFIQGLNPREFFFHACSGREGMSDTAVGTAVSGYIQRRIVKLQEDIKIQYDGTVRDETGRIFQLKYGDYGFNPEKSIKSKGTKWFMDLERLADRFNQK